MQNKRILSITLTSWGGITLLVLGSLLFIGLRWGADGFEIFIREITENARTRMVRKELGEYYRYYETLNDIEGHFGVQARMPFTLELH